MKNVYCKLCSWVYWYFFPQWHVRGCLHFDCNYLRQSSQFKINFPNCSFNPGQWTISLACGLHVFNFKCPSWISFRIDSCFLSGTTILVPFKIKPSSIVNSSLKVQYGCNLLGTSLMLLGHPWVIVCFNSTSLSSSCIAILSWFKLSLLVLS